MVIEPTCLICSDGYKADGTVLIMPCGTCGASWCMKCVLERCIMATKSLGEMPPKCCLAFDPRVVLKAMPEQDHTRFKTLFDEYRAEVKDRVYCPNTSCGVFISPFKIAKQQRTARNRAQDLSISEDKPTEGHKRHDSAVPTPNTHLVDCEECNASVCLTCKQAAHPGSPCNIEDDPIIAQLQKFGYKRCPRCGFGTRRMWGCTHMQCVCGAHWCWSCERNFNVCDALGGCEEEYDEDSDPSDDEDEEMDEEMVGSKEVAEEEKNASTTVDLGDGSGEVKAGPSVNPQDPVVRRRRSINLDRGSHAYWENEGLNFGEEPDGNNTESSWGCTHEFECLRKKDDDELGKQLCWECWETAEEESAKCWLCRVVRCKECLELFEANDR